MGPSSLLQFVAVRGKMAPRWAALRNVEALLDPRGHGGIDGVVNLTHDHLRSMYGRKHSRVGKASAGEYTILYSLSFCAVVFLFAFY